MSLSRFKTFFLVLAAALSWPLAQAGAAPVENPHLTSELIAQGEAVPGAEFYVAIHQMIEPGWHTYWRNPGDAGEPTTVKWTLPPGWTAGDIEWPAPSRLPYSILMNYGYSNEAVLPVAITPPAGAKPGETVTLKAETTYMVCSDVCIPGEATLELPVTIAAGAPKVDQKASALIQNALQHRPLQADLTASAKAGDDGSLILSATGEALRGADIAKAYFYPYDPGAIDHAAPQPITRGPDGLSLKLTALPTRKDGPLTGVLSLGDVAYEISAAAGPVLAGATGDADLPAAALPGEGATSEMAGPAGGVGGSGAGGIATLVTMALAALAGGLILNLMPCVFPVLSMKAASLATHVHDNRLARTQGLVFMAGVLATFLLLAALLIAARTAGAAVGWGFQLQSPPVSAGLAILMLLVALNLAGVFEIATSIQGVGSGLAEKSGLAGSFFTGALAVVVAAPCTAPFMGPALAYALGQPALVALIVFAFLGLGFAAPFTIFAFAPPLLKLVPRPGAWMAVFRTVLAFPMFGAAGWLAWVFAGQAGHSAFGVLLVAGLAVAFAAWLFGQGQRQFSTAWKVGLQLVLPLSLVAAAVMLAPVAHTAAASAAAGPAPTAGGIVREAWSPEKVAQLQAEGRTVFVDFTADWCITCKVNEATALAGPGMARIFEDNNVAYLVGDWTNRDADIAAALAEHGRVGVPLYLVYGPGGGEPEVLPQLLTEGVVKAAIGRAGA